MPKTMDQREKDRLRKQAEERLLNKIGALDHVSLEAKRLIEELHVHQIELEIQNEELRRSQSELQMLQSKYFDLFENAPVGYATLDLEGIILEANFTFAEMLGVERRYLKEHSFSRFVASKDQVRFMQHFALIKKLGSKQSLELRLIRGKGPGLDVLTEGIALEDALDKALIRLTIIDISDQVSNVKALKASESRFHFLYENTPTINLILDAEGIIQDVNMASLHDLGYTLREVINKPATAFIVHRQRAEVARVIERAVAGETLNGREAIIRAKDGTFHVIFCSSGHELVRHKGADVEVMFIGMDITKRRRMEKALKGHQRRELKRSQQRERTLEQAVRERTQDLVKSNKTLAAEMAIRIKSEKQIARQKEMLENIFNHIPIILCLHDPAGTLQLVNRAFEKILGWTPAEAKQSNIMKGCYPDPLYRKEAEEFLLKSADGEWRDFTVLSREGEAREISWASVFLSDGTRIAIGVDFSERNRAERALRESEKALRYLSARLLKAQEEERRCIALDLHDSIAAALSAVKLRLQNTVSRLDQGDSAELKAPLVKTLSMVKNLNVSVRRLMSELRPSVLDDLGLIPALRSHCGHFQEFNSQIRLTFSGDGIDEQTVPEDMKIVVFRIVQEALTNVGRHSEAERAWVTVNQKTHGLEIEVGDNGTGFEVAAVDALPQEEKGFGLSSMRERVRLSEGSFSLESVPGKGTIVRAAWSFKIPQFSSGTSKAIR